MKGDDNMENIFIVKSTINAEDFSINNQSTLHAIDRLSRMLAYKNLGLADDIKAVAAFVVDKNHPNGDEVHVITNNGLILIFNKKSKNFITVLGARGNQIKRYYNLLKMQIPKDIMLIVKQAYINTGKNNINNL